MAPHTSAARELGFLDGLSAFFGGVGFIVARPAMWPWALVPTVVATLLFFGFGGVAVWATAHWDPSHGAWHAAGVWALRAVLWLLAALLAFLLALSLAQPLSGFALDTIARRQELATGGREWPDQPFFRALVRSLGVTLTALALSLPLLAILAAITLFVPPAAVVTVPLKLLVTSLAVAYDFLDYPLGLRGAGVGDRLAFIRRHFAAVVGFGAAATLVLLIPGVGLLLLPFGVAGATRLVRAGERG